MADLATLRVGVDSREVKTATTDLNALGVAAGSTEQKTNGLSRAFGGLRGVLSGIGFGLLAREAILMADTMTRMSGQLALVTNNAQELAAAEKQLFSMSQNTRVGYESTVSLFTRLARSTENLGVSQQSVMRVTETINKAMIVSGTSAEQASGALMQLGQAFASGALRGDELNSVMEGMPRIAQAIADGMGITVGELRKLGAQGKLTGAEVYTALLKMGADIDSEFSKMPMTVAQSMTVLKNSLMLFIGDLDNATGFTKALTDGVVYLSNNLTQIMTVVASAAAGVAAYYAAVGIATIYNAALSVSLFTASGATSFFTAAITALNTAMLANPAVWFAAAIAGLAYVFISLANNTKLANEDLKRNAELAEIAGVKLTAQSEAALKAANEAAGLGAQTADASNHTFAFTKELNASTVALREQATAARRARIEILEKQLVESQGIEKRNLDLTIRGRGLDASSGYKRLGQGDILGAASEFGQNFNAILQNLLSGGRITREAVTNYQQAATTSIALQKKIAEALREPIGMEDLPQAVTGVNEVAKAAQKAIDPLEKYRDALKQMRIEGEKIGMTPEQAKAHDTEKLAVEALAAGSSKLAKEILAVGDANAKKQSQYDAAQMAKNYKLEAEAIGKTAIELKQMEINQNAATVAAGPLRDEIIANGAVLIANTKAVEDKKKADEEATKAADEYKKTLEAFNNLNIDINFDALFGDTGKAMGGVVNVFDQMLDRQEKYNALVKLGFKDDAHRAAAQQRNARLQINQYANLVGAAKGFFKQGTSGYKAMEAAEKAFRLFELVMAAKSAAVKIGLVAGTTGAVVAGAATETAATAAAEAAKTGTTLAGTASRIVAKIAEGAASMFASLGPLGFAAVAAMVGVMASFGFAGGGSRTPPKYNTGTGTVLGDNSAQSESLTKSIERLAEIDQLTMRYSAQMASSLKSIEANIGGLTSLLVRTGDISASGAGIKTGTSGLGDINKALGGLVSKIPVLGTVFGGLLSAVGSVVNALFGTKTSIVGQGLSAVAQTMGEIVTLGFEAQNFTNVQRKGKFLGVTTSTRYSTQTTEASDEVNRQFTLILEGFYDAISAASNPLGLALNEVQERLNGFVVNIGQIDLKDLTGQEIQEKLTAVFGAAADSMARAAITGLDDFQKVGEGYFETIVRVASGVEQAQQFLRQLGVEAIAYTDILNKQGDVTTEIIRQSVMLNDASAGIAGGFAEIIGNANGTGQELYDLVVTLRDLQQQISATGQKAEYMTIAMISAAGGLDAFQSGLQSFYDDILTDSERSAIELARLTAQFQSLGVAMPASREAFKTLIQSIDVTTASGQALYGSLIALTPAFVDLIENTTASGEQIDLSNQRRQLEIQLMEAQGNASGALAARRALELAAMDETLRSLQQQIWAAEDAKAASEEAAKLASQRANLEIQLMEALGNASGALAARRSLELAAMDESLRALQRQIYAAQDAKAANEAAEQAAKAAADAAAQAAAVAAQAAETAARIATERTNLEIQLMEALGNASGALAARRALELAAVDETNRALLAQIHAAEDAAKAAEQLADAQAKAAEEAAAAAEAAASLARDRRSLEIELMEALGNSTAALTARRALELEGMDATLRGLQQQIWAAEDATKATQELAEAQARAAELARERRSLEIELMDALGNSSGALAARRALELAAADETNRALIMQIHSAQDAAKAAEELATAQAAQAELARQRQDLEIQLMEATGNASGALAARRALELEGIDATLRGLQQQIWAAEDAAKAAQELADAQAAQASLARQRQDLEIQLMEALGNSTGALAARRELELAGMDETLRALQRQIYTAQDAARATQELADAQASAAALARQRRSLEIELMDIQGNTAGATAARRALELEDTDETLRALREQIFAAQDARAASEAAAEAAARAAEEQARAMEAATALNRQRRELEIDLLEAQGFAVQALAARRALELEGMDASLRALQQQIYAAQDKAEEDAKAAKVLEDAANAMKQYQDALANVTETVIEEINRLRGINASSSSVLLKAQFATLTAQARTGNLDALGKLPELSRSIEEATLGTATSALEVARIRAWLAASLSETLAVQTASNAQVSTTGAGLTFDGNNTAAANAEQTSGDLSNMGNMLYNAMYQVARNTGKSYELMDRWDGDGLPDIREDASDYY